MVGHRYRDGPHFGVRRQRLGQDDAEYAFLIAQRQLAEYTFKQFMLRFALGFAQTYVFCWELTGSGPWGQ